MEQALGQFFYDKVLPALNIIYQSQEIFGDIILSYNGGKDCTIILEIIEYFHIDIPVVVFEEPDTFPELIRFTSDRLRRSPARHYYVSPNYKLEMQYLVANGVKGVLLGQRTLDPASPRCHFERSSPGWPDYMRIFPILNWTYHDIWYFLDYTQSQYCELYANGYTSIGSVHNTLPNPKLQGRHARELISEFDERLGRI